MAKWIFTCNDNGGRFQSFTVTAPTKQEAIFKAMLKARKRAAGDIIPSSCKISLKSVY